MKYAYVPGHVCRFYSIFICVDSAHGIILIRLRLKLIQFPSKKVAHFLHETSLGHTWAHFAPQPIPSSAPSGLIACYLTFPSSNARLWMSEVHWHTQPTRKACIYENREALTHERRLRNTNSVVIISLPQLQLANEYTIYMYKYWQNG